MRVDTVELKQLGLDAGLDAVGVAPAAPFLDTRRHLVERRAAGLHGGMQFTYRNPERSTDPSRAVEGARALVVGARAYRPPPARPTAGDPTPRARVAAYACHDEYAALRRSLGVVADRLVALGFAARVLADDNALVDRAAAYRAGLGWYGKNANILLPGRGSWFVLGSVVTNASLDVDAAPVDDGCGACRRCLAGCPTNAIVAPGVVDARRCLAWLLQQRGDFPREHRVALHDRIYGCDDCQEVCPHNGDSRDAMDDAVDHSGDHATVPVLALLADDDAVLLARHGRWYIPDRDPRYLRRNALVVLGNVGDPHDAPTIATLTRYLDHHDAMLRSHAAWAARRLGRPDLLDGRDPDPAIADELLAPAPPAR